MPVSRVPLVVLCLLVFAAALNVTAAAAEQDLSAARDAFARGAFADAATLARAAGTAEGFALAARAELTEGDFLASTKARRPYFEQAEKDARTAIADDPANPEGHLYLALALGFIGRMEGSIAAHFAGYAEEARIQIDKALALAPNDPWANALSGGWNLEIVRDGGLLGETLYGASFERGVAAYERALSLDPGNVAIAYQYALQLAAMGDAAHRDEALHVLAMALRSEPGDALETLSHLRAQRLKITLDTHDDAALQAIIRDRLGGSAAAPPPAKSDRLRPFGAAGTSG